MCGGCIAWVSMGCLKHGCHADFSPLFVAYSLVQKHRIAQQYLPPAVEALAELENVIVKTDGSARLDQLKAREADFKKKVVNHEEHGKLDNPYDLPVPSGMLYS